MIVKKVYVANNGREFDTPEECLKYEIGDGKADMLLAHIKSNCGEEYNGEAGFSIINPNNVRDYIISYLDEISAIVNGEKI